MLFAIRASVELEVTDFVTVEKIVKIIFFFMLVWRNQEIPSFLFTSLYFSLSRQLGRHIRENFNIKKKTFFYINKVFIILKNNCMGENLFSFKKTKLYVIEKDFMIRKRKKLKVWKEVKSQSTEARIPIPLKHDFVLQWNGLWLAQFSGQSSWFSG